MGRFGNRVCTIAAARLFIHAVPMQQVKVVGINAGNAESLLADAARASSAPEPLSP